MAYVCFGVCEGLGSRGRDFGRVEFRSWGISGSCYAVRCVGIVESTLQGVEFRDLGWLASPVPP